MAAINLPYMMAPGTLEKILNKICQASVPETFNADFLGTKLGFKGGSARMFISWAKKCGLLNTDGKPTQLYINFRNPEYRGVAMAEALKKGYQELYLRNEYAHDMSRPDLTKLVSEVTGLAHDNTIVKAVVGCFFMAKKFANFEVSDEVITESVEKVDSETIVKKEPLKEMKKSNNRVNLGLNYTINLVLPKTDDPAVYKAIFTSLKENLLDE